MAISLKDAQAQQKKPVLTLAQAQAAGKSPSQASPSPYGAVGDALGDASEGFAKAGLGSIKGLIGMGQRALDETGGRLGNLLTGKGFTYSPSPNIVTDNSQTIDEALAPKGTAQKVGFYGEKAAELLVPSNKLGVPNAVKTLVSKVLPSAEKGAARTLEDALAVTTKPFNKKATVSALENSGRPGGFAESTSPLGKLMGKTEYVPNDYDKRIAQSVADVVSPIHSPVRNIQGINNKIAKVSEEQVTPLLQSTPGIFNTKTYNAALKSIEPPDYVKTDAVLEKTYDLVRERFVTVAAKHPKTKLGLWEARKELDSILEEQFGRGVFDPEKYSVFQRAVSDMRRATNEFINEGTNDAFKGSMRQLSDMFEARGRIALDNYRLANSSSFKRWAAEHPTKLKALELILGGGAAAIAVPALID
jgi:hypothetical protein